MFVSLAKANRDVSAAVCRIYCRILTLARSLRSLVPTTSTSLTRSGLTVTTFSSVTVRKSFSETSLWRRSAQQSHLRLLYLTRCFTDHAASHSCRL